MVFVGLFAVSCFVMAQNDTTNIVSIENSEPRPISSYGGKNVIEEYSLQSPRISKRFDNKKLFDHAFIEAGMGLNSMMGRNVDGYLTKPSASANISFGDWITPEHGWRLTGAIGYFNHPASPRAKYISIGADYLMNLTAISKWEYPTYDRMELYGVAGFNVFNSQIKGEDKIGYALNLGLKGVYRLSSYTYVYLEPRASLNYKMLHGNIWYKIRPSVALNGGVGFSSPRVSPKGSMYKNNSEVSSLDQWPVYDYENDGHWLNNMYVTLLAGPSLVSNFHPSTWNDYIGSKFKFAVGKMFNPYIGAQLSLNGGINKLANSISHAKMLGVGAEAVWNMHNTFGGYNPYRKFYLNAIAGLGYNINMYGTSTDYQTYSWSLGGGLQANYRLCNGVNIVIEPRIDVYGEKFIPEAFSMKNYDVIPSLLLGFNIYEGVNCREISDNNSNYDLESWYDDMFVELAGGVCVPFSFTAGHNKDKSFRPRAYMSFGKWFNALSGARLWLDMGNIWQKESLCTRSASYGIDYLLNFTNAFKGYDEDRRFNIVGGVGLNTLNLKYNSNVYLGAQLSAQALYKINNLYGVFIEPQARFYDKNALKYSDCFPRNSVLLNMLVGVKVNMKGYQPNYYADFDNADDKAFFSVSAGLTSPIKGLKHVHSYGPTAKISFGKWYSPISAWRLSGWGYLNKIEGSRYGIVNGSLDYLLDASAFTFGYNPDRVVSTRIVAGVDLGMDFYNSNVHFVPQVHFGGQLAVRVSPNVEIFAEPQYIYVLKSRFDSRLYRTSLQGVLGLNYSLRKNEAKRDLSAPEYKNFASASFGLNMMSGYVDERTPEEQLAAVKQFERKYRVNPEFNIAYGRWFNGLSAYRVGVSCMGANNSGYTLYQLHLDYLANMKTLLTGKNTEDEKGQLRGILGVNAGTLVKSSHSPRKALGLELGLQAAYLVSPRIELFVEPMAQLLNKNMFKGHSIEGIIETKLGVNYKF